MIIALDKGQVTEVGTHDELVSRPDGVYAKLYALQAFDDEARS
jgi:ABC-type multidrug transport system fused ATPase/permease subunit